MAACSGALPPRRKIKCKQITQFRLGSPQVTALTQEPELRRQANRRVILLNPVTRSTVTCFLYDSNGSLSAAFQALKSPLFLSDVTLTDIHITTVTLLDALLQPIQPPSSLLPGLGPVLSLSTLKLWESFLHVILL